MRYIITLISLVILDQLSKYWIVNNLQVGESISLINKVLNLTYVQNSGAAFGIMQGKFGFFIIAGVLVISLVSFYNLKYKPEIFIQYLSGLIVGGSIGNLSDRIIHKYVIDFFDLGWWPVFNIADIAIVGGSISLLIYLLFIEGSDNVHES